MAAASRKAGVSGPTRWKPNSSLGGSILYIHGTEGLPFSRIRCTRTDPYGFTVESHRATHLIAFAEPAYPAGAKTQGIEGTVLLNAVIDREGGIMDLSASAGHPWLAEAALETVRHWRYRPTAINGIPVEVQTEIQVTFTLPESVKSA